MHFCSPAPLHRTAAPPHRRTTAPRQISGFALGLAGLALALVQFGPLGGSLGGHGLLGLLVSALGLLQPLDGMLRPKKGALRYGEIGETRRPVGLLKVGVRG